jgi:hypothetical protein
MGISDEQVEAALTAKPFGAATVRSFIGAGAHDEEVPAIMRAALLAASRVRTAEPVAQLVIASGARPEVRIDLIQATKLGPGKHSLYATPVPSYADAIRDAAKIVREGVRSAGGSVVDYRQETVATAIEALSRAPQ